MIKGKNKVVMTKDGSNSIYHSSFKEHYHSTHGAIIESKHVYIKNGLLHTLKKSKKGSLINIFEMGFGTGLNVLLTVLNQSEFNIDYTTIDCEPLKDNTIESLN